MDELIKVYQDKGIEFINGLLTTRILVTQKISGVNFSFIKKKSGVVFYKNNEEITDIDRILMNFYEVAIQYILSIDSESPLPEGYKFNIEYFPNQKTYLLKYKTEPKNQMILISVEYEGKEVDDDATISKFSQQLGISNTPCIFSGYLNDTQKQEILDLIYLPKQTLLAALEEKSFSRRIIEILNPSLQDVYFKCDDDMIEGVIFNFKKGKKSYSAKIIDPLFLEFSLSKPSPKEDYPDMVSIIMSDIIVYMDNIRKDIKKFVQQNPKDVYLNSINHFYNLFLEVQGKKYSHINLSKEVPSYFLKKEFQLNLDFVGNDETVIYLSQSLNNQIIYRIFLTLFRKKKKSHPKEYILSNILIQYQNEISELLNKETPEVNEVEEFTEGDLIEEKKETSNITVFSFWQEFFPVKLKEETKRESLNLLVGEFQPFHLGHLRMLKEMYADNKRQVLVLIYKPQNSILTTEQLDDVFSVLKSSYPYIKDFIILDEQEIPVSLPQFKDQDIDIVGAGEDATKFVLKQIEYLQLLNLPAFKKTKILKFHRKGDEVAEISGKILREYILAGDYKSYKERTPKEVWSYFPLLEQKIKELCQADPQKI